MYCCGPTVYDFLHVGNFRGAVFYNFVFNWLQELGYRVTYAYNFTDVDDKILKRAKEEGVLAEDIASRFIDEFYKDFNALKLSAHSHNPKVTDHIASIIELIQKIVDRGYGYVVDGEVFYAVDHFDGYGKLSNRQKEDMRSGSRIEVDPKKRSPLDFTLWKPAGRGERGWPSPWGNGRPGWHIECSAMNQALFGDQIDIHGGGMDLIFPHHENEIAQSEAASGKKYVGYWIHNNMFTFGGDKMSKSLGNVRIMRDFLEKFNGEIFKYLVLCVHYRSEADFTNTAIENAIAALGRIYSALNRAWGFVQMDEGKKQWQNNKACAPWIHSTEEDTVSKTPETQKMLKQVTEARGASRDFFNDDFATPQAMAELFNTVRLYNQLVHKTGIKRKTQQSISRLFVDFVRDFGKSMALFQEEPSGFLRTLDDLLLANRKLHRDKIDALVTERIEARSQKNYEKSDRIRDQLNQLGIELRDTQEGTFWEVKKS